MKENLPDVGVIVGRFQVDELHEAHEKLIQKVVDNHSKVIIFLGLSPVKCSVNNPLDFEARKQMILDKFPNVNVLYIKDVPDNTDWSFKLDESISDIIGPNQTVLLYGGRDGFLSAYYGKFKTQELKQTSFISGKAKRKEISNSVKASADFRKGVIWATMNQYPKPLATVDVAIFNEDGTEILLGRKPNETKYRFIGGFVNSGETFESAAKREVLEETGLEISYPKYITSCVIDDWRYKNEVDKITTSFFISKVLYGTPTPNDDIVELRWFKLDKDLKSNMVMEHQKIIEYLLNIHLTF